MNTPEIKIVFDKEKTGSEILNIYVNNIYDAVALNIDNPKVLEELRQDIVYLLWKIENVQAKQTMPITMRKPENMVTIPWDVAL